MSSPRKILRKKMKEQILNETSEDMVIQGRDRPRKHGDPKHNKDEEEKEDTGDSQRTQDITVDCSRALELRVKRANIIIESLDENLFSLDAVDKMLKELIGFR